MSLLNDIPRAAVVGLDTAPIIYYLELHADYEPIIRPLFEVRIPQGDNEAVTSTVSLAEVLVKPLKHGRGDLVVRYRSLLLTTPHLALRNITPAVAERAADLRARYGLQLPDTCQIAAALEAGASVFVTNDAPLRRVTELTVLVLSDYLPPAPSPPTTGPVP